jgi:hypothetical protein
MKILRYMTIAATLLLASMAGTSGDDALQQAACKAGAFASLMSGTPAGPAGICR